jgi:hypothetical protein
LEDYYIIKLPDIVQPLSIIALQKMLLKDQNKRDLPSIEYFKQNEEISTETLKASSWKEYFIEANYFRLSKKDLISLPTAL